MGVFIVVGSNSTQTYHVAVRRTITLVSFTKIPCADIVVDRRILSSRLDVRAILDQYSGILFRRRNRSIGSWIHPTLYGHGMSASNLRRICILTNPR